MPPPLAEPPLPAPAGTHAAPADKANPLFREYETARNWRALFENLIQRAPEGGGFYAVRIIVQCAAMRSMSDGWNTGAMPSRAQEDARRLFTERCADFTPEEISMQRAADLLADRRLAGDPLRTLFNQAGDDHRDKGREWIARALATRDPLLLESIAGSLFMRSGGAPPTFEGTPYPQEYAGRVFVSAWMAAVCEGTGNPCGATDRYVNEACALENLCAAGRRALFADIAESRYGREGRDLYDAVYPAMVRAVRGGNVDPFF